MESSFFHERDIDEVMLHGRSCKERRKIVGAFLYEDTTTLIFSRTNYGKSILAFQFAYAAATGTSFDSCSAFCNECEPMKVVVIDLELDTRTLWERHGIVFDEKHPFRKNLLYFHEKSENNMTVGFDLLAKIEERAASHQAKLVVIDNISKLLPDALRPDTATMIISMLNRIRILTGASILVIGHTTKGNPRVCIQPTDYYGSAMLQNFFNELSYLDMTKDGNFFLCQSKTKHKDNYSQTVPVLTRGDHPHVGYGFSYCYLQNLTDIQLPMLLMPPVHSRNLADFKYEISILIRNGISQNRIAKMLRCSQSSISALLKLT